MEHVIGEKHAEDVQIRRGIQSAHCLMEYKQRNGHFAHVSLSQLGTLC